MLARMGCAWWVALLSGSIGCGAGADVSSGREAPLSVASDAGLAPEADAALPMARRCDSPVEGALQVAFQTSLKDIACPGEQPCSVYVNDIKAAPDASAWVLGHVQPSDAQKYARQGDVWVGHFGRDGALLGSSVIAAGGFWSADIAVDDRSQAWVAWQNASPSSDGGGTQIHRYDAAAQELSGPLVFAGLYGVRLARVPGQGIALTALLQPANRMIALLSPEGEVRWSHQDAALGVSVPTAAAGQIVVSSMLGSQSDGSAQSVLQAYGLNGDALWTKPSPQDVVNMFFGPTYFMMEGDVGGNVTVAAVDANGADTFQAWVRRVRADGEPQWLWLLDININSGFAVEYETGRVFVGETADYSVSNDGTGNIQVLSADGELCRRYSYSGVSVLQRIALAPNGELYFVTFDSVGRFGPIGS